MGRIRRQLQQAYPVSTPPAIVFCALCLRALPPSEQEAHHLIPRSKGGKETVLLHRICHKKIHTTLSETELAREFFRVERLRTHPEIAHFLEWVQNKPAHFYNRSAKNQRLRKP